MMPHIRAVNQGKVYRVIGFASVEGQSESTLAVRREGLVENFSMSALAEYGLNHPNLAVPNPRLICCSIPLRGKIAKAADCCSSNTMPPKRISESKGRR